MLKRKTALFCLMAGLIASLPAAAAAADGDKRGRELVKRGAMVTAANGATTQLTFRRNGTVEATYDGRTTSGTWEVAGDQLCFTWRGNFRECWPYRQRFERGEPTPVLSNRGNRVVVTLR